MTDAGFCSQEFTVTAFDKQKGRQISLPPLKLSDESYYFRPLSVASAESLAMNVSPHHLEPMPPGLIGVALFS